MKNKTIVLLLLSFLLVVNLYAFAEDGETVVIDSVTLTESADDESLIEVDVSYTASSGVDEVTLFMTVDNGADEGQFENAVYINQVPNTDGTYQFPVDKAKVQEIAGTDDIEGLLFSLKMGGTSVSTPSVMSVAYDTETGGSGDAVVRGDTNGDGNVDFVDALLVLKHDAGTETLSGNNLIAADANSDGTVDFVDALLILKYDAGLISDFN